jgi:hypothetical protein
MRGVQDGTGSGALFEQPMGIAYGGNGAVYVSDAFVGFGDTCIRQIDTTSGKVTTVAGGTHVSGPQADGVGLSARFGATTKLASNGVSLFVIDKGFGVNISLMNGATIREMSLSNYELELTTYGVTTMIGAAGTYAAAPGVGTGARINVPSAFTYDPTSKRLLLADEGAIFHVR